MRPAVDGDDQGVDIISGDFLVSLADGGQLTPENLVAACKGCNSSRDSEASRMNEHFQKHGVFNPQFVNKVMAHRLIEAFGLSTQVAWKHGKLR